MIKEFKEFIIKGNAIDLAVGIVIGAAFGMVVNSLVKDIMTPPLGYVMGGIDFSSMTYVLADAIPEGAVHPITQIKVEKPVEAVEIRYGLLIQAVISLLIQGFAVFLVVKGINAMKRSQPPAPAAPPADVALLGEIRDLLKQRS